MLHWCDLKCRVCGTNVLISHALHITVPVPMTCHTIIRFIDGLIFSLVSKLVAKTKLNSSLFAGIKLLNVCT